MEGLTRLVLIDDHPILREGLIQLLESHAEFVVCGQAGDFQSAVEAVDREKPDVVVVDLSLPGGDGIELTRLLRSKHPDLRVLVLSGQDETLFADRVLQAGACGYVMKGAHAKEIIAALRAVRDGGTYLSTAAFARVARRTYRQKEGVTTHSEALTAREQEVLAQLTDGLKTTMIAEKLGISVKTVYVHLDNIRDKLGLETSADVTRYALLMKPPAD